MRRVSVGLLLGVLVSTLAGAAPAATAEPEDGGSLLVIMDVSGSMDRRDSSGTTLIAGARRAIRRFVDEVPGEVPVGLRLYGSEYAGDNERTGCRDTRLAVPIGPVAQTGSEIIDTIDSVQPTGFTPIGHALTEAAEDFAPEGKRSIVLVSDGEDTCGDPEPCAAAKRLAGAGIDVRVDTVGLFLQDDPAARRQLQCVADATDGTYVPARDSAALVQQLTAVSTRAVQRFQAAGEEIDGGPALVEATPIDPGTYVDDVVNGESRWYSFELEAGQGVTATLTEDGTPEYGCCLEMRFFDPEGDSFEFVNDYNDGDGAKTYLAATDEDEPVEVSGTYYFTVHLDQDAVEGSGALDYQFALETTGGPSESASPSAAPSPTPPESASPAPAVQAQPTSSEPSDAGGNGALWAVIAVLTLLVLGLGTGLALMWRRLQQVAPPR